MWEMHWCYTTRTNFHQDIGQIRKCYVKSNTNLKNVTEHSCTHKCKIKVTFLILLVLPKNIRIPKMNFGIVSVEIGGVENSLPQVITTIAVINMEKNFENVFALPHIITWCIRKRRWIVKRKKALEFWK